MCSNHHHHQQQRWTATTTSSNLWTHMALFCIETECEDVDYIKCFPFLWLQLSFLFNFWCALANCLWLMLFRVIMAPWHHKPWCEVRLLKLVPSYLCLMMVPKEIHSSSSTNRIECRWRVKTTAYSKVPIASYYQPALYSCVIVWFLLRKLISWLWASTPPRTNWVKFLSKIEIADVWCTKTQNCETKFREGAASNAK